MKFSSAQGTKMQAACKSTLYRMGTIAAIRGERYRGPLSGGCHTSLPDRFGSIGGGPLFWPALSKAVIPLSAITGHSAPHRLPSKTFAVIACQNLI
jgi:hypothetical protein